MMDFTALSLDDYNEQLEDFGFHHVTETNKQVIVQMFEKYKNDSQFVEYIDYYYQDEENEYDDKIASLYCGTMRNEKDAQFIAERDLFFDFVDYLPEQCWIVKSNRSEQWYMVMR